MLKARRYPQTGFSLTDLLMGSTIGLMVLSGGITIYSNLAASASIHLAQAHLNAELRATQDIISRNLRRAGYWSGKPGIDGILNNPFQSRENYLSLGAAHGEAASSCITFAYDRNKDKLVGVGNRGIKTTATNRINVEQFGYRIHKGAVESRTSGSPLDCNSGRWQDLTSTTTLITGLRFILHQNTANLSGNLSDMGAACTVGNICQTSRLIEFSLSGHTKNRTHTLRTINSSVQLRNDHLVQVLD